MGEQLVNQLLAALAKMTWPENPAATPQGRVTYEIGLDKVEGYSGDPRTLAEAIRIFRSGGSAAYAYAGVAYVLLAAAQEPDGSYAPLGLDVAMAWLEKAQALEPDVVMINMIEALVYVYHGRFPDARMVLDYLHDQEPDNYHVHLAEVAYWMQQGDVENTAAAVATAVSISHTPPQRLRLRARLADFYLEADKLDEALEIYKESVHFEPQNALLWHKVSQVYFQKGQLDEAERANQQSLRLGSLPAAQQMTERIKARRKGESGLLGGLFKR
ncbi:MAG: tetratricopeptide repeat protein [Chloroflexi bacterium]|nr:tetratricopeptide repeat protein [Chloroflexota bacterium]